ncbi:MAG: malto-oligosyltrehalose trehalohydrolase [Gemmataceae bacterium]|nr:malto-oligosyltrehalose trehalohydrolase [Gemmataceae bacterium]
MPQLTEKPPSHPSARRLPVGAEPSSVGTRFRVWAPGHAKVSVSIDGKVHPLAPERDGCHAATLDAPPGTRYAFLLGDDAKPYPDPASRWQPDGPHGPSAVVDPSSFAWTDAGWKGVAPADRVMYEMHIGTFTPEGTWEAAVRQLPELAKLGVTVLEVMPVAEFPGRFGWGYDGVNLFAPTRLYGSPDDFRRFVDAAHRHKIAVILDVVYNHLGPDGNYLGVFSPAYFNDKHKTDWGKAINFDGEGCGPVRDFYRANARHWIEEYHLDGLRFDATQDIHDGSSPHILAEIVEDCRAAVPHRTLFFVGENEPQHSELARAPEKGGYGIDALWNDDFHHSAMVAMTGRNEAYYTDYHGSPQEFVSAAKWGYLYQGQRYVWQKARRGRPGFDLPPWSFVSFTQNHDQIANSACSRRCHQLTSPGRYRAMTALMLLMPSTPMLFQGQEWAAPQRFCYFADHNEELAPLVENGRKEFLAQFRSLTDPAIRDGIMAPHDEATFQGCKLDPADREEHHATYGLHAELLELRRADPALRAACQGKTRIDGAVLGPEAFVLRWFHEEGDRLLLVNLGRDLHLAPAPEPLLAPPLGCRWRVAWSSEASHLGGCGVAEPESDDGWRLAGHAAALLRPEEEVR